MNKLIISTLAAAIALGTVSTAFAAPKQNVAAANASAGGLQHCITNLLASGVRGDAESGLTAYEEAAARCMPKLALTHGR